MDDGKILTYQTQLIGLTVADIAQKLGLHRNTITNWRNSKSIPLKNKILLKQEFGINWNSPTKKIPIIADPVYATVAEVFSDTVGLSKDAFIDIPIFSTGEYAFQVTGNSMKGLINAGDWIVIKRITNREFILYGEAYVIITKGDNLRTVKFLNEHEDENKLWLSPYNIEQFQSQEIYKEEILSIWKVLGLFRKLNS